MNKNQVDFFLIPYIFASKIIDTELSRVRKNRKALRDTKANLIDFWKSMPLATNIKSVYIPT